MKRFKRIYIEITNRCNYNCSFCPKIKREDKDMLLEEFKHIIKEVKEYTDYIYLHVKGEPLIHKDLEEILKEAENNNLNVIITTNGSLLKQKHEILKQSKALKQINISVHSFEQNKVKQENKINNQENYIENILVASKNIVENSNVYISYRFWNLKNIEDVNLNVEGLNEIGEAYNILNILDKLKNKSSLKLSDNVYINLDTIFEWPDIQNDKINQNGNCYGLKTQLAILSNGDVVPCCLDQDANIKLGNIFEKKLEEILKTKKVEEILDGFKQNILTEELCQKCEFRKNKRR